MTPTEQERLARDELSLDLKAAVLARRELDPDMEDHLLDSFLTRIEQRIDIHVSKQLTEFREKLPKEANKEKKGPDIAVIMGTFALSIPLMGIASVVAHTLGVVVVMAGVVAVILLYFIDRWATK